MISLLPSATTGFIKKNNISELVESKQLLIVRCWPINLSQRSNINQKQFFIARCRHKTYRSEALATFTAYAKDNSTANRTLQSQRLSQQCAKSKLSLKNTKHQVYTMMYHGTTAPLVDKIYSYSRLTCKQKRQVYLDQYRSLSHNN